MGLVNKYHKLLSKEKVSLKTCQDIRNIYDEIVLDEVVSEDKHNAPDGQIFRKDMTEVYSSTGKSIHKGKYPESEIITYMEKALKFLNDDDIQPLYRICLFHYMIEFIHPFYDGNGRTGRMINILYLTLAKILDIPILYLSKYINQKSYVEEINTNLGNCLREESC